MKRMSADNLSEQGLAEVLVKKTISKTHKLIQRKLSNDTPRESDDMLDMYTSLLFYFTTNDTAKKKYNLNFFLMFEKAYADPYIRSRQTIYPDGRRSKEVTCPPIYEFFDLDTLIDYNIYLKTVYKSLNHSSLENACASAPIPSGIGLYNEPHNRRTLQLTPDQLDTALTYLKRNFPKKLDQMYFVYKTISTEKENYEKKHSQRNFVTNTGKAKSPTAVAHPPKEKSTRTARETIDDLPFGYDTQPTLFDYAREMAKKPKPKVEEQKEEHREEDKEDDKDARVPQLYYDSMWGNPLIEKNGKLYTQNGKLHRGQVWAPDENDQWDLIYDPEWDKPRREDEGERGF